MIDTLFGSASGTQPFFGPANRLVGSPMFGAPMFATAPGTPPAAVGQAFGAPSPYAPGTAATSGFGAQPLAPQLPFGVSSAAAFTTPDAFGVTAQALLAAVAMRRGQPQGPTNDQEIEDFVYDAFELLAGTADVEVRCESGRVTITGSVPHKRIKRDVGEIAWAIPSVNDVQNNVTITSRRRARSVSAREPELATATASGRKQT